MTIGVPDFRSHQRTEAKVVGFGRYLQATSRETTTTMSVSNPHYSRVNNDEAVITNPKSRVPRTRAQESASAWYSLTILLTIWGELLGMLDVVAGVVANCLGALAKLYPSQNLSILVCNKGIGTIENPLRHLETFLNALRKQDLKTVQEMASLDPKTLQSRVVFEHFLGIGLQEVTFQSPAADLLPDKSKRSHCWLVKPSSLVSNKPVYVISLASTGEVTMFPQVIQAWFLAILRGWTTIILTTPLCASRKPKSEGLLPSTLEILLSQSIALTEETAAITRYVLDDKESRVCMTGFSFGGAISIYAAALALLAGCDGRRISIASYAGAIDPSSSIDGQLSNIIDWEALAAAFKSSKEEPLSREKVKETAVFYIKEPQKQYESAIQEVAKRGQNTIQTMKLMSFQNDNFIPRRCTLAMNEMSRGIVDKETGDFQVTWMMGGHVMAALARPVYHTWQILDAVDSHELRTKTISS